MLALIQATGRAGFGFLQRLLAWAFVPAMNPLRHLGALTIFFFWIVLVSGIWLFLFFKTSVHGAYDSVEYLTNEQWYLGGVMRSLHRYASDGAIITIVLHMLKEFTFDRHRGKRWFSWLTGMPLIWLVIPLGITGYWLVWDELALYVALASSQLLDGVAVFTGSMVRNFLSAEDLSDRFFTLMAFLHLIGLPLLLVFGIWLHVFRISRPRINPPRRLMVGVLLAMLVLSLLWPAVSQGPADPAVAPESVGLDWYYLTVYPLISSWSPGAVWAFLLGVSLLICVAPWLPPARRVPVAKVDLDNCNGCRRCVDDCPFSAVGLEPRSDGKAYKFEAVVDPDLCVSCGICVGACPTAMPFRVRSELIPGIDLPDQTAAQIRADVIAAAERLRGPRRVLTFCCQGSKVAAPLRKDGHEVLEIRCMAHLPPPFIDYILNRNLADGVYLAGCPGGDCQYRFGDVWTRQRIGRERDPQLRGRVDVKRVALSWQQPWSDHGSVTASFNMFAQSLPGNEELEQPATLPRRHWVTARRAAALVACYTIFSLLVGWLSSSPRYALHDPGYAIVSLSLSHAGQRLEECKTLSAEELAELPPNMRVATVCPRSRAPVSIELHLDGETVYQESIAATGIHNDGEMTAYQRFPVLLGEHRVFIGMRDSNREEGFDYEYEGLIFLEQNQHLLVEFDHASKQFLFK